MKIFSLFVSYGSERFEESHLRIKEICYRNFNKSYDYTYSVDNLSDTDYVSKEGFEVSKRQNEIGEFTAWDYLIKLIETNHELNQNDIFIFSNDSFYVNYGDAFLTYFRLKKFDYSNNTNWVAGYVDDFPKTACLLDLEYDSWIRSNFFIMPYSVVKKIIPFVFPMSPDDVFSNTLSNFWSNSEKISLNFKAYISSWLFGVVDKNFKEYQLKWYKHEKLSNENLMRFRKKAMCILSEHYLSARLKHNGVTFINVNPLEKEKDRHIKCYYQQQKNIKSLTCGEE